MNIVAINEAIEELEQSDTTVENIQELASLYVCRDNLQMSLESDNRSVEKELNDILPYYRKYVETKR